MNLLLLALAVFVGGLFTAGGAQAQKLPYSLLMSPELMPQEFGRPRDPSLQLAQPDPSLYRAQRRNRMVIAAGVGILSAAAVQLAVSSSQRSCYAQRGLRGSRLASSVMGGVGLTFTLGGILGLRRSARDEQYPATRGQRAGAFATALGSMLATSAVLMLTYVGESIACSG